MLTFLYILEWILILLLLGALFILFAWMWSGLKSKVPFITVPRTILPYIQKALNVEKNSVVYDLGCGDGRVLFYSAKLTPEAKYIGIENSFLPLLLARFSNWQRKLFKKKNASIKIIDNDLFQQDLSSATRIFMYLYPNLLDDLLPKFDRELKKGTRVVSVSFQFTLKRPIAEIDLKRPGLFQLARKLYIYEF